MTRRHSSGNTRCVRMGSASPELPSHTQRRVRALPWAVLDAPKVSAAFKDSVAVVTSYLRPMAKPIRITIHRRSTPVVCSCQSAHEGQALMRELSLRVPNAAPISANHSRTASAGPCWSADATSAELIQHNDVNRAWLQALHNSLRLQKHVPGLDELSLALQWCIGASSAAA
jgi:hypothetical protein